MRSPTKKTLKKWNDMTEANEHGLVREEIAKWFQNTKEWKDGCLPHVSHDYLTIFKYIDEEHEAKGQLPFALSIVRNLVTNKMFDDIARFNRKVSDKINECL